MDLARAVNRTGCNFSVARYPELNGLIYHRVSHVRDHAHHDRPHTIKIKRKQREPNVSELVRKTGNTMHIKRRHTRMITEAKSLAGFNVTSGPKLLLGEYTIDGRKSGKNKYRSAAGATVHFDAGTNRWSLTSKSVLNSNSDEVGREYTYSSSTNAGLPVPWDDHDEIRGEDWKPADSMASKASLAPLKFKGPGMVTSVHVVVYAFKPTQKLADLPRHVALCNVIPNVDIECHTYPFLASCCLTTHGCQITMTWWRKRGTSS